MDDVHDTEETITIQIPEVVPAAGLRLCIPMISMYESIVRLNRDMALGVVRRFSIDADDL